MTTYKFKPGDRVRYKLINSGNEFYSPSKAGLIGTFVNWVDHHHCKVQFDLKSDHPWQSIFKVPNGCYAYNLELLEQEVTYDPTQMGDREDDI